MPFIAGIPIENGFEHDKMYYYLNAANKGYVGSSNYHNIFRYYTPILRASLVRTAR